MLNRIAHEDMLAGCEREVDPRCATIEFDYPTGDPVVLELVNMPVSLSDAGVDVDASSDGGAP